MVCTPDTHFIRFSFNKVHPTSLKGKNVTFTNEHGTTIAQFKVLRN